MKESEDMQMKGVFVRCTLMLQSFVLFDRGSVLLDLDRLDEALDNTDRCQRIQANLLGSGHPDAVLTLARVANLYNRLGRHQEAMDRQKLCFQRISNHCPQDPGEVDKTTMIVVLGGIGDSNKALGAFNGHIIGLRLWEGLGLGLS
jgi:tetratricopeptide (TPR) repeat protein